MFISLSIIHLILYLKKQKSLKYILFSTLFLQNILKFKPAFVFYIKLSTETTSNVNQLKMNLQHEHFSLYHSLFLSFSLSLFLSFYL